MDSKELINFEDINKRGINICHINARSIKGKLDDIKWILSVSNMKILCITETWLTDKRMDSELQISHFNLERNDRQSGKKGGGLLTYIHESLIYTKIVEISNSETQLEQLWITANQPKGGKFIIGNIYRPPNENHKASLDTLKKTLQGLSSTF